MQSSPISSPNSSLIQDDLLMQMIQPLDMGYPIGPSFLHSLSTIVEAATLHDFNYFDPLVELTEVDGDGLQGYVRHSDLTKQLISGGAIHPFPPRTDVDLYLKHRGADYEMIDLCTDVNWTPEGTSFTNVESEVTYIRSMAQLLEGYGGIFRSKTLLDYDDLATIPDAQRLLEIGVPKKNLIHIEGQNHRLSALQHFSGLLRLNLYTNAASMPNQIGMIRRENSIAKVLYEKLTTELESLDNDDVGSDGFAAIEIPELVRIVLRNARGDASAIAPEILALRYRHEALRGYLTAYDREWLNASSKRQRERLQIDFNNAWETFLKHERRPRDRLIYKLWGILKNPSNILGAVGDKLVESGRRLAITGQVRGLPAFWKDLLDAPVAQENFQLLSSFHLGVASEDVWEAYRELGSAIKTDLKVDQ